MNARSWFNFLLNRPLGDTVLYESLSIPAQLTETLAKTPEISGRSELRQIEAAGLMQQSELELYRRYAIPRINAFLNAGIQDFNWEINRSSRYAVAGVQVMVPLFEGFRNRIHISSSKIDLEKLSLTKEYTERQFSVAASVARSNLGTAVANMQSAEKQYQSARAYFNLIEKGYSEGINSLIEYMDARHQLTQSELQVRITKYKLLTAFADLERQTATSTIQ
jgi:outer membrane protein TolC